MRRLFALSKVAVLAAIALALGFAFAPQASAVTHAILAFAPQASAGGGVTLSNEWGTVQLSCSGDGTIALTDPREGSTVDITVTNAGTTTTLSGVRDDNPAVSPWTATVSFPSLYDGSITVTTTGGSFSGTVSGCGSRPVTAAYLGTYECSGVPTMGSVVDNKGSTALVVTFTDGGTAVAGYTTPAGIFTGRDVVLLSTHLVGSTQTVVMYVNGVQVDSKTYTVAAGCGVTPPPVDVCPNIDGNQTEVPAGMVKDSSGNCVTPPPATTTPKSTTSRGVAANTDGEAGGVPIGGALAATLVLGLWAAWLRRPRGRTQA